MSDEEVAAILARKIHGERAEQIIRILAEKVEVSDEDIAKELNVDATEIRRILNELFESRLVKYRRARDEVIGWYKYFWRITDEPISRILEDRRRSCLTLLQKTLEYEKSTEFYICPSCHKRFTSMEADANGYICDVCGSILDPYDNSHIISKLEKAISQLRSWNPESSE
ncbi:MAG: transcription factor [Infirmifilum sp.]